MKPVRAVLFSEDQTVLAPTAKSTCWACARPEHTSIAHATVRRKNFLNPPPSGFFQLSNSTHRAKVQTSTLHWMLKTANIRQGANACRSPDRSTLSPIYWGPPIVYPIEAPTRTTLLEVKTSVLFRM